MPDWEYKTIEWSKYDDRDPPDVIDQEAVNGWEFYSTVDIHAGRIDFVFRRDTQNQ